MKKFLTTALTVFGSIGLAWFVLPIIIYGVVNIGTFAGVAVFTLLILYGRFFERTNGFFRKVCSEKRGKAVFSAALILAVFLSGLAAFQTYLIASYAANRPQTETTVIVLGCKVNGENPSLTLLRRLEAAEEYLSANPEVKCIVTGGQGNDETMTEAECMYRWLVKSGIDPDRIYREDKSASTRENLEFSKEIIEKENLCRHITIVTNEFHQYRAGRIAKNLGLECYAISGKSPIILLPTYVFREYFSITYEWIR